VLKHTNDAKQIESAIVVGVRAENRLQIPLSQIQLAGGEFFRRILQL